MDRESLTGDLFTLVGIPMTLVGPTYCLTPTLVLLDCHTPGTLGKKSGWGQFWFLP